MKHEQVVKVVEQTQEKVAELTIKLSELHEKLASGELPDEELTAIQAEIEETQQSIADQVAKAERWAVGKPGNAGKDKPTGKPHTVGMKPPSGPSDDE